jgi:Uma2 family endonuclease
MAAAERMSLEEFLKLPETKPASELICGEVVQKPMPDDSHSAIQLFLGALIRTFLLGTQLGKVRSEFRCIFGPPGRQQTFVPDLVYVSYQRRTRPGPGQRFFQRAAPDLIVEVLSLDQNARRFTAKINFYLRHGVRLVWVIDPEDRVITIYRPDADSRDLRPGDVLDGEDVLPGFSVAVSDVFAEIDE